MRGIRSEGRDKRVASEMALVSGQLGSIERWLNGLILVLVTALDRYQSHGGTAVVLCGAGG